MISFALAQFEFTERMQPTLPKPELSDEALMQLVLERDHQAFYTLAERWSKDLINFFDRHLHQPQSAEDLAQEVLLSVWKTKNYRSQFAFKAWIYKIARHKLIDYCRKHKELQISLDEYAEPLVSSDVQLDEQVIQAELAQQVRQAIADLPQNQQSILILSKYQQLDHADIAQVLNCSKDSVKVMLFRAVKNLGKAFKERYGQDV